MANTQGEVMEIKMVGKLTIKATGANPKLIAAVPEGINTLTLCRIFGMADGVKQKEDPISGKTYFPLVGRFEGRTPDGKVTRSGVLYLPSGIHETYEGAVRKLEEGETLNFAIEIRAVKSSNPAGYSYEAIDLMPPSESDPMAKFAESVEKKVPLLTDGVPEKAPAKKK